ncbi:MAG: dihydroorotate dehydrogenase electron transfer subunit [Elusimicrobiota bacterium]
MKQFQVEIKAQKKINQQYYLLTLTTPQIAKEAQPGQFLLLLSPSKDVFLRRPFTFHSVKKDQIQILYKVVGPATKAMAFYQPGDKVDIIAPLGKGFEFFEKKKAAILVGGGSGVAGLFYLAERIKLFLPECAIKVILGAKNKDEIIPYQDFLQSGIQVAVVTEDGSLGKQGLVTDFLEPELSAHPPKDVAVYACGPRPMLKKVAQLSQRCDCQVSWEEMIACGVGCCGGCVVKSADKQYPRVCVDGPVFDAREIGWE